MAGTSYGLSTVSEVLHVSRSHIPPSDNRDLSARRFGLCGTEVCLNVNVRRRLDQRWSLNRPVILGHLHNRLGKRGGQCQRRSGSEQERAVLHLVEKCRGRRQKSVGSTDRREGQWPRTLDNNRIRESCLFSCHTWIIIIFEGRYKIIVRTPKRQEGFHI